MRNKSPPGTLNSLDRSYSPTKDSPAFIGDHAMFRMKSVLFSLTIAIASSLALAPLTAQAGNGHGSNHGNHGGHGYHNNQGQWNGGCWGPFGPYGSSSNHNCWPYNQSHHNGPWSGPY